MSKFYKKIKGNNSLFKWSKVCFSMLMCFSLFLSTVESVSADEDGDHVAVGVAAVSNYSGWSDLSNINSTSQIASDISSEFSNAKKWNVSFVARNNGVYPFMFRGKSVGGKDNLYGDNVDLLFYTGHGLKPNTHGASDYSFALNPSGNKAYVNQSEMFLGNRDLEWLVTFTCNFLNGGLQKIGRLAYGVHSVCGYRTDMTITANAGELFCHKLKSGISVKEAFFAYAKATQRSFDKNVAAVFTTRTYADECIWGYGNTISKDPKPYKESPSDYVMYYYNCY